MKEQHEIIIKKVKKGHPGHHGGAWKVAYADFVTAMMALFMVLWLVAMMSVQSREVVATYFRSFSLLEGGESSGGGEKILQLPGEAILLQDAPGGVDQGDSWKKRLEEDIKRDLEEKLAVAKDQVFLRVISGGVRIEIVERSGLAMFGLGEARLLPHGEKLLEIIAGEITKLPYPIWIEGHTDAFPYPEGGYTNWELSVDRANSVRKELEIWGTQGERITKVIGYAATDPIVRDDPYSPLNRRVSIVVKEKKDDDWSVELSGTSDVPSGQPSRVGLPAAGPAPQAVSETQGWPVAADRGIPPVIDQNDQGKTTIQRLDH
jgi:chemotaxis protein MotB